MIFVLDIGGTYTKYAHIEADNIIKKGRWQTTQDFAELMCNIDKTICEQPEYIGISSGGFWDKDGTSLGYESIRTTADATFVKKLREAYDCPVYIENDARCALLAEQEWGVLKNESHAVLFVLGSSLGCAVLLNKALYYGATGQAGAMFMMPELFDGNKFVFDQSANSLWLTNAYQGDCVTGNMLLLEQKALDGDQKAADLIDSYARAVALKCWYAYLMYDPACIALGGGISNSDLILEKIKTYTDLFFRMDTSTRMPKIILTAFGEDSNLLGAMLLGRQ